MKKIQISSKVKKAAASTMLGVALASGVLMATSTPVNAFAGCDPEATYICELSGIVFLDYKFRN